MMEYRINRRTGDRISVIGIGSAYLSDAGMERGIRILREAYEGGINYFDLAAGNGRAFSIWGEALHDVRRQVFYQIHFGADYSSGTYGWSLDPDTVRRSVEWQLETLRTDYIDYGFIHCQDEEKDWNTYREKGIYRYLLRLHEEGVVRHLGLSSHTPSVIRAILDEVPVDMLMFSVNPAYDCGQGEYANGSTAERQAIYRRCEKDGIGISVMKPFSGGQLLRADQSPFRRALSPWQCIRYALDKPGVLTILAGAQTEDEVRTLLRYDTIPDAEKDYGWLGESMPQETAGTCVYCNHCKPCPAGLDIGLINKYYDLARYGDDLARAHYAKLERHAEDCTGCGHCDRRCPFGVTQSQRMQEIREYMGM